MIAKVARRVRDRSKRRRMRWGFSALTALVLVHTTASATERHRIDQTDLRRVAAAHPKAVALFEQAEAARRSGKLAEAEALLARARKHADRSPLLARTHCRVLTELGRRDQALEACQQALDTGGSPLDLRATVGALMSGDGSSVLDDLRRATQQAEAARRRMPKEPWGYAAECDIAIRLHDSDLMSWCVAELERVAPGHEETLRARRALEASVPTLRFIVGWGLIGLLGAGTLAHAGSRRRRGLRKRVIANSAAAMTLAFATSPAQAEPESGAIDSAAASAESAPGAITPPGAALPSRQSYGMSQWPIDEADPERTVPTPAQRDSNPLQYGYHIMDLTDKASAAAERGDHLAEAKFYRAIAKAAPERAVAFAKLCRAYAAAGEREQAIQACTQAAARPGITVGDQVFFARLFLENDGELGPEDTSKIDTIVDYVGRVEAGKLLAIDLGCELAVRLWDSARLERCTADFEKAAPGDPKALQYQWALAMVHEDHQKAEELVSKARELGLPADKIAKMEEGTRMIGSAWWRLTHDWRLASLAGLLLLTGGGLATFYLLRRRAACRVPASSAPAS